MLAAYIDALDECREQRLNGALGSSHIVFPRGHHQSCLNNTFSRAFRAFGTTLAAASQKARPVLRSRTAWIASFVMGAASTLVGVMFLLVFYPQLFERPKPVEAFALPPAFEISRSLSERERICYRLVSDCLNQQGTEQARGACTALR